MRAHSLSATAKDTRVSLDIDRLLPSSKVTTTCSSALAATRIGGNVASSSGSASLVCEAVNDMATAAGRSRKTGTVVADRRAPHMRHSTDTKPPHSTAAPWATRSAQKGSPAPGAISSMLGDSDVTFSAPEEGGGWAETSCEKPSSH